MSVLLGVLIGAPVGWGIAWAARALWERRIAQRLHETD